MILTDQHISDKRLNELIAFFEYQMFYSCVNALLEFKQRRAEDRWRKTLTDQHISSDRIIAAIEWIETPMWLRKTELQTEDVKSALLEVLQRRAEDRQRGTIDWTKNTVHHLQMDE